ncbi:MAG: NrsF family protein [Myxococcota bacterium]
MTSGSDRLIDGLVEDLEPVTPLLRVRQAFAVVLAVWAAVLGVVLWSQHDPTGAFPLFADGVYATTFVGLMIAALAATLSALAAARPGREGLERLGLGLAAGALGVASVVCLVGLMSEGSLASPPGADAMCLEKGVWLSLLPAGVVLSFLVRGWAAHPIRAALIGLVAAGALGGVIVHLSCDFIGHGHLLRGHMAVPLVLAVLGTFPAGVLIRRLRG